MRGIVPVQVYRVRYDLGVLELCAVLVERDQVVQLRFLTFRRLFGPFDELLLQEVTIARVGQLHSVLVRWRLVFEPQLEIFEPAAHRVGLHPFFVLQIIACLHESQLCIVLAQVVKFQVLPHIS